MHNINPEKNIVVFRMMNSARYQDQFLPFLNTCFNPGDHIL